MSIMESLQTGILASDLRTLSGNRSTYRNKYSYPLGSIGKSGSSHGSRALHTWEIPRNSGNNTTVTAGRDDGDQGLENRRERTGSEERMIIKQTTTTVQFQDG